MGDIKFSCSRCSRHLAADASNAGQPVNCPECGNSLIIPTANQTPHNTDSAANTTSSEPVLKQYSETKSEIYKRQSFFQNLRLTFSIARQKTKRQLLESVDLRRAEINLGKTAIEANKFENEHPEIYARLKVMQIEAAQRAAESKPRGDLSLKKEIERGAGKVRQGVISSLKLSEFDQLYIRFSQIIMDRHRGESSVENQCRQIDGIVQRIKVYDEQILEMAQNTSFLFRHPAVLMGVFILSLLVCCGGYSSVSHWWKQKKSDEQMANAIKQMTFDLEKSNIEMKKDKQDIQNSVLKTQKQRADLLAEETARLSIKPRPTTAPAPKSIEAAGVNVQIQQLGDALLKEVKLTPNIVVDAAFGSTITEIKGENFPQIANFIQGRNLSGLISSEQISEYAITETYARLFEGRSAAEYEVHVRPSYGVRPDSEISIVRFIHYNPIFQKNGKSASDTYSIEISGGSSAQRYPDGVGFTIGYRLVGERIVIFTGPFASRSNNFNSFRLGPLLDMQHKYKDAQANLLKLKQLGDIDDSQLLIRLQKLEDTFYEAASNLAKTSVR